jgi:hypothetical protein
VRYRDVCLYEINVGFRLPFPNIFRELFCQLKLAPRQIKPNGWKYLMSYCLLWPMALGKDFMLTIRELLAIYRPIKSNEWPCSFEAWVTKLVFVLIKYLSTKKWETLFFLVSGDGWEFYPWDLGTSSTQHSIPCQWVAPPGSCKFSNLFCISFLF